MNLNSLITKITLIFLFTISLFIAVFIFYIKYEKESYFLQVSNYHEKISNYIHQNRLPPSSLTAYVQELNFEQEFDVRNILDNGNVVFSKRGFETIEFENSFYLHILTPRFRILFKDLGIYETNNYDYVFFSLVLILLFIIYFWLIKSIKPLVTLKEEINKFSNGNMNIDCKSDKKDEIAEVANEFDNAVKQISLLLNSRQLFLRTIMHELKTPIAKGRIVSELIDDDKQKNRMITIFERLEFQINDFSRIEQVVSKNYNIVKYPCKINTLINNSINMLMIEKSDEKIFIENISTKNINVDKDLFSMAVKNLIDNALKYSYNNKVQIKEENGKLLFISKGKALEKSIEEYFKPFHNDTKSKNHGMGLGLYIVFEILKIHDMYLEYEYNGNENIFKIVMSK
ncbi:ArsS family sensor histidine kinase [Poseidonibacter sp.]|uniref:ArsS family sensor histidine kinase n=1 Tax=Poseidonibacter sp. TaxID=2321188 RepID=UPI003C73DA6B